MSKNLLSHIMVGVTGSAASIAAAKYAIVMAKQYKAELSALYVVDTATIKQLTLSKIFVQDESAEYERSLEANGKRYLDFVEELAKAKGVKVSGNIRRGAIYTEMVNEAADKKIDLIVLGGWEKDRNPYDLFSTSQREIMINAKCSVLLVKNRNVDELYKMA
jgi:nucleotide-binding universal stress UspA family protein